MADILICNGDAGFIGILESWLSRQGHRVEVTRRGSEAIRKVLSESFEVVIQGIRTEDVSGLEVIPILNRIAPALPIIAVADDDSLETERGVRAERIFYYCVKPVDSEEMRQVIQEALAKS